MKVENALWYEMEKFEEMLTTEEINATLTKLKS